MRWACAFGVFLSLLLVYRLTIIPTMVDQDSGELVAAAHVLGIAHPTGYPLWTVLGRVFDLLPLGGTSAYRVAILSAVSAAAAGAILTWLVIALTGGALAGLFAGLAFGLWFPSWSQAVRAEVYTLSGLLFALFLFALFRWDRARSLHSLSLLALAGGFVSMHHRTAFLAVAPALAMAFWLTRPRQAGAWVKGALLFLAPFLCYLYLPIRAAGRPPVNWTDPIALDRFLTHATGAQYTHFALNNYGRLEVLAEQAGKLLGESLTAGSVLSVLLALIGLPLIVWGFVSLYRSHREAAASLAVGSAMLVIWVLGWGETTDLKVFLGPLGAMLALCGGWGLARVEQMRPARASGRFVAVAAGAAITALLLVGNWARADQSNLWQHRDRWVAALSQMERNAIFISDFDVPSFATIYLQNVEGLRKDVTLLRTVGMMQPWYVELIQDDELRQAADRAWKVTSVELDITGSGTPQFWQGSALFAYRLAQHYRGRRPVYALHGPMMNEIPGPPYFIGLSEDLVRLDFVEPDLLRNDARPPIATFPGGVELVSFTADRDKVGEGGMLGFSARWRCSQPAPMAHFAVWLVPQRGVHGAVPDPWIRPTQSKGRFEQGFPLLCGQVGLPPSPAGTVYEQRGSLIIPTGVTRARGGAAYTAWLGFSSTYPPQYAGWTEMQVLHIEPQEAAANPP